MLAQTISTRLTSDERASVEQVAGVAGIPPSQWVRELIVSALRAPRDEWEFNSRLKRIVDQMERLRLDLATASRIPTRKGKL